MKKNLRLLMCPICNRSYESCCNNDWQLEKLPIVQHFNYDLIMLTGGEPLLFDLKLQGFILALRIITKAKIIVYTAYTQPSVIINILHYGDGITLTLHEQADVKSFLQVNQYLEERKNLKEKSLRLNVFKGVRLPKRDYKKWKIKTNIEWSKNCPLPENEEFKRLF